MRKDVELMLEGVLDTEDINLNKYMDADFQTLLNAFEKYINMTSRKKLIISIFFFKKARFPESVEFEDFKMEGDRFKDILKIKLKRRIERGDLEGGFRDIEGIFFVKHIKNSHYIALTLEDSDFFEHGLLRLLENLSPDYTKPVLTSKEILKLLFSYTKDNKNNYNVIPKRTIFYDRNKKSDISHISKSLDEIVYKYKNENLYVNKIRFKLINKKKKQYIFSGSIRRDGSVEFREGNMSILRGMINKIFEPVEYKSSVFNSSDRNNFKRLTKKSIRVEYEDSVLSEVEDNERLFKTLENIPRSDFLVFHHNPYLHVSFFDYVDGSKFDIFGLDDKTICIVPYEGATESSFNNMLEGIQKEFGEGVVDEFFFHDYSLKDITA